MVKLLFKNNEMMSLPTIQKIKNFEKSAKLALNLRYLTWLGRWRLKQENFNQEFLFDKKATLDPIRK